MIPRAYSEPTGAHTAAQAARELDDAHARVDAARHNVTNARAAADLTRALDEINVGRATLRDDLAEAAFAELHSIHEAVVAAGHPGIGGPNLLAEQDATKGSTLRAVQAALKAAANERAETDSYRDVIAKVAVAAGCPGAPTRWNVADLVERVTAATDLAAQRHQLDEFDTAVRGLLDPDVPPWVSQDEVVFHLREQLQRAQGNGGVDTEIIDEASENYRAGYEAGRAPEIVTGEEAADLPVGTIVVRDYSERDYAALGFRVPHQRFPLTRTAEGFRTHHTDPEPDDLASNLRFRILDRGPEPARTLAVGDVIASVHDAARLPDRAALRSHTGTLLEVWHVGDGHLWETGSTDAADPHLALPARVIDLPEATP